MTATEFIALPPEERDVIVAEKVLGWKLHRSGATVTHGDFGEPIPPFSTDWRATAIFARKMPHHEFPHAMCEYRDLLPGGQLHDRMARDRDGNPHLPVDVCVEALQLAGYFG